MKLSKKPIAISILSVILAAIAFTSTAHAATLCVDPGGAGGCYTTIQAAINAASPGDTINVAAGTYAEDLIVDKALTILGPNSAVNPNTGARGAEAIITPATSFPDPWNGCTVMMYIEVDDVTVQGFTFDGNNSALTGGIQVQGVDTDACEGISSYEGIGGIKIENNIIKQITYAAIDLYNYVDTSATANNFIRYNHIYNIGGTDFGFGIGTLVYNNFYADITDNVYEKVRVGIQTGNYYRANVGTTGSISNNTISSWKLAMFHNLWYSNASIIPVRNNVITAESNTDSTKFYGMLLSSWSGSANTIVENNTITIGDISQTESGGYNVWNTPTTAALTIKGGTVTGGQYGVFVNNWEGYSSDANDTAVKLDGVLIKKSSVAGVYVKDSPNNTRGATVHADLVNMKLTNGDRGIWVIGEDASVDVQKSTITRNLSGVTMSPDVSGFFECNNIYNNTAHGMYDVSGSATIAELNYWGDPTGPYHATLNPTGLGNEITGTVDFDPWNTDSGCGPALEPTLIVKDSEPKTGAAVAPGLTQVIVEFNSDVESGGGMDAADYVGNYLLVEKGVNKTFDTVSCSAGLVADDVQQTIASASYDNGGGTGPYKATLNLATPLAEGNYRLFVCGTTSIWSTAGLELNDGTSDSLIDFEAVVEAPEASTTLPATGFEPGVQTAILGQPEGLAYNSYAGLWMEIPRFGTSMEIVGVPNVEKGWDVTWLGESAGWLHGSAFPTFAGNTVITGHVWNSSGYPGPFMNVKSLGFGDIVTLHKDGYAYTYAVQETELVNQWQVGRAFQHKSSDWLTLLTCEGWDAGANAYSYRRLVRAILVDITPE